MQWTCAYFPQACKRSACFQPGAISRQQHVIALLQSAPAFSDVLHLIGYALFLLKHVCKSTFHFPPLLDKCAPTSSIICHNTGARTNTSGVTGSKKNLLPLTDAESECLDTSQFRQPILKDHVCGKLGQTGGHSLCTVPQCLVEDDAQSVLVQEVLFFLPSDLLPRVLTMHTLCSWTLMDRYGTRAISEKVGRGGAGGVGLPLNILSASPDQRHLFTEFQPKGAGHCG
eukprot:712500-Pelagomonas_calceolata.AAC.1